MLKELKNKVRGREQGRQANSELSIDRTGLSRDGDASIKAGDIQVELSANQQLDMDQIFGILQNKRRRYVLKHLWNADGKTTIGDLAEQIAAWECEKQPAEVTAQEKKRVYVSLYQSHLSKMADCAAIHYDPDEGRVQPGERYSVFMHYLHPDTQPFRGSSQDTGLLDFVFTMLR